MSSYSPQICCFIFPVAFRNMSKYTKPSRQTATIMFSDMVGYTSIMGENEDLAYDLVKSNTQLHKEILSQYDGRLVKELGDGLLCVFPRADDAVQAAYEIQKHYRKSGDISLRIGIHMGEIIEENGDVFGDAVNIAARIESLGSPNSILFSDKVYAQLSTKSNLQTVNLGIFKLKNVDRPIEIHALSNPGLTVPKRGEMLKLLESRIKKVMIAAVIALTLLSIGLWFNYNSILTQNRNAEEKTLAVLPFTSLNQQEEDFLTDGLTEDIIMQLSKISELSVISKSGVDSYKNTNEDLKSIAQSLSVNYILEGKIQRINNRIKVNTSLIEVAKNKNIWADSYERDLSDIFELQSDIAQAIAISLSAKLTDEEKVLLEKKPTESFTAYEYYMRGRNYYYKYNVTDNLRAIEEFRKAIRTDPDFALAYAGLGDAFSQNYGRFKMERFWIDSAKSVSQKAIALDSNLSEAYKSLATAHYYNGEYEENFRLLQKAVDINPNNVQAVGNLATSYFIRGELDEAIARQKKAAGLNPKNYIPFQIVGWTYRLLKDYRNAELWLKKSSEILPEIDTYEQLALTYIGLGDKDAARSILSEMLKLLQNVTDENGQPKPSLQGSAAKIHEAVGIVSFYCGDFQEALDHLEQFLKFNELAGRDPLSNGPIYLAYLYEIFEKSLDAEVMLEWALHVNTTEVENDTEDPDYYFNLAMIYAIKGDRQKSMNFLNLAEEKKWVDVILATHNPIFQRWNNDPDFLVLIRTIDNRISLMNIDNRISR